MIEGHNYSKHVQINPNYMATAELPKFLFQFPNVIWLARALNLKDSSNGTTVQ